jgi:hypothetical protein
MTDQEREALKEILDLHEQPGSASVAMETCKIARAALAVREEPPESALLDAAEWVLECWDRNATQHASIPALRAAVQTASAAREEPPKKYAICQCGHLAYWHSAMTREGDVPQGAGSCEEKPDCRCERFAVREDTERPDKPSLIEMLREEGRPLTHRAADALEGLAVREKPRVPIELQRRFLNDAEFHAEVELARQQTLAEGAHVTTEAIVLVVNARSALRLREQEPKR